MAQTEKEDQLMALWRYLIDLRREEEKKGQESHA